MTADWAGLAGKLESLLGLAHPVLAITFADAPPEGVPAHGGSHPAATPDGRTGAVPAGCVFWIEGRDRTFSTVPADHGNCSVGSLTHGLLSLEEAAVRADVAALVGAEWVTPDAFPSIPTVATRPGAIVYGPLRETPVDPDVAFLRVTGKQAMSLHDAWPSIRLEGKPQCHVVPIAKERGEIALSVGCMLSRVRTGMPSSEMTCAIPARLLPDLVARLEAAVAADRRVAAYAAEDAGRFG